MSATYAEFAATFGKDQADMIVAAAKRHKNGVHDSTGSDPFKWALCICIGYECMTDGDYRAGHGITVPVQELKDWVRYCADLGSHDGDIDFIAAFGGGYEDWVLPDAMRHVPDDGGQAAGG